MVNWLLWFGRAEGRKTAGTLDAPESSPGINVGESMFSTQLWLGMFLPGQPATDAGRRAVTVLKGPHWDGETTVSTAFAEQSLHDRSLTEGSVGVIATALIALVYGDQLRPAAEWCQRLLDEARSQRSAAWSALFSALRAEIALRQGDLTAAARHAQIAMTLVSPAGWGLAVGAPLSTLVEAFTAMGRYEEAAEQLRTPVPDALLQTPAGLRFLEARGRYLHATGRYTAALSSFQTCGDLMARWQLELPAFVPWRTDAAQSCLRLGRPEQAQNLAVTQLKRLGRGHSRTRGLSLRVLAASSAPRYRTALLRRAVESLDASGDHLELAYALHDLGASLSTAGQYDQARTIREQTHQLAVRCGAEPLRQRLMPDPTLARPSRKAPPEPETHDGTELSEAERRVAMLAAQGHTNRQIATLLYVTTSTVEQHLTRVYRKLRIKRRTDLPLRLDPKIRDSA